MHKKKQTKDRLKKSSNVQKSSRKDMAKHRGSDSGSDSDSEEEMNRFAEIKMASGDESKEKNIQKEGDSLMGFSDDSDQEMRDTQKMMIKQNRKNKKSGGFQSMGLSHNVLKGIIRNGYKIPTPIQRKTIPLIRDGKDVVAMARTGSGKTAAFLIPMFERLKTHVAKHGARALIMSPTRELALQTLKFTKKIGKFTGLRSTAVLGGDKMEDQFESLHGNPDIIIATPGRFMHVVVQMDLKLHSVEYVVFDEADRLFEMGFQEQLTEILQRLPEARQSLLFSATLPKLLVEFAKAGLHDPTLLRLDVDTKLSENLKLTFLQCRHDDKLAVLLHLLRCVVKPSEQTVIFVATKHHVEYIKSMLEEVNIKCSYIYSSLDQTARKINIAKFTKKQTMVLLVTDLAARGIDIPMLDNVINYNFPAKPKLFVHRVGRVARAGRSGTAYSLVSPDELPYVLDLHLFLGRPLKHAKPSSTKEEDGLIGRVPQSVVDEDVSLQQNVAKSVQIQNLKRVCSNAHKQYVTSRPAPSSESVKRMKSLRSCPVSVHPMFETMEGSSSVEREQLLELMRSYKPNTTIFEINSTNKKKGVDVMRVKRKYHADVIQRNQIKTAERNEEFLQDEDEAKSDTIVIDSAEADEDTIQSAFSNVVAPKYREVSEPKKKKKRKEIQDENYLHYRPTDYRSEMGLSISHSFEQDSANAVLDLTADDEKDAKKMKGQVKKWDRKKKKVPTATLR